MSDRGRVVNCRIDRYIMSSILRGHVLSEVTSDVPEDVEIVNCSWDGTRGQAVLTLWSSAFDEFPEGALIPEWSPTFKLIRSETQMLYEIVTKMGEGDGGDGGA